MNQKKALKQIDFMKNNSKSMRLAAEKWNNDFKTIISTILSARNRDEKTIPISKKLFEKYPSAGKLSVAKISDVEKIIKPINFYKNKARNIIETSKIIAKEFNGRIPREMDKLLGFPGVGRKTANIFLSEKGEDAIAVDTHVSYISQKLNWTKNKKPEKIEEDLKEIFPKKYWKKINPVLVRFGKSHAKKEKDKLIDFMKNELFK